MRRRLVALKTCLGHLQFLHQFGILRLDGFGLGRELLQPLDLLGGLGLFVLHRFLQVFNLCVLDGYEYGEVAELLETSEATCRWHVHFARKKLQQLVKKTLQTTESVII